MQIYKIENTETGKCYIGRTLCWEDRKYHHKWRLRKGYHSNRNLQNDWDEYGEDMFNFEIIEECETLELLYEKEQEWVTKEGDYNVRSGGLNERKAKPKPVYQYTKDGELVEKFDSVYQAKNQTGIANISKAAKGRRHTAGGYKWSFEKKM